MDGRGFEDFLDESAISDLWLLAHELSVVEAALLLIDCEPQEFTHVENYSDDRKPSGYLAARQSLASAIRCGEVEGEVCYTKPVDRHGFEDGAPEVDFNKSFLKVSSFRDWLVRRGFRRGFLFRNERVKGFRDKSNPRYSAKLAAVVEAWEALEIMPDGPGTPKQHLAKWLRLNASRFGFVDEEGKINETVIEALAKVANWQTGGGAPKTYFGNEGTTDPDFDDPEIPF